MYIFLFSLLLIIRIRSITSNNNGGGVVAVDSNSNINSNIGLEDLYEIMSSLNASIQASIHGLNNKIDTLNITMHSKFDEMDKTIRSGLNRIHDAGTDRYNCLKEVSGFVTKYGVTGHAFAYKNKVGMLTVKHFHHNISGLLSCKSIDVSILPGCPKMGRALNIEGYVPLRVGDRASTLGFIRQNDEIIERY